MDAPTYPPAAAFEQPVPMPYERLTTETASLAALQSSPAAWAIVIRHAPSLGFIAKSPMGASLGNMTADTFASFGDISPNALAAINAELGQLPRSQWPAQ